MAEMNTPLFDPQPVERWVRDLMARSRRRLDHVPDERLVELLEDALYTERRRLERDEPLAGERERLDRVAHAVVRGDRHERIDVALSMVAAWTEEIHGRFDRRVYGLATRVLPRALTGLLSARPQALLDWSHEPVGRVRVEGPVELLQSLAGESTLVLAPTHVSNLDSPVIGLALYLAGLPPFVYGAGLNLFANPLVGWWLRHLGAYTVDRKKKALLYKDVLKDYSVANLTNGLHSLFFPGGTRSRSGRIETTVKKGLLGTTVQAWQENLANRKPNPEIYVVPMTLSFQLVLEASSLIDDALSDEGRSRYIIDDDEFSEPRRVATFFRRLMELDDAVVVRFGDPLDCLGNKVPWDPEARRAMAERRHRYVTDAEGHVEWDEQRDRRYTDRLADALVDAYPRGSMVLSTHLVAWVAWSLLEDARGTRDPFRIVRIDTAARHLARTRLLGRLERAMEVIRQGAAAGRWHQDLPGTAKDVLALALDRFARYHRTRALAAEVDDLVVEDPRLCLYYRNRLTHAADDLEVVRAVEPSNGSAA